MKEILDYITNNVTVQTGSNVPQFPNPTDVDGNVYDDIGTLLADENVSTYVIYGCLFDDEKQNTLYYGYYVDSDNNNYGFVYIVNDDLEKVAFVNKFTSGTNMFPIYSMNQDEYGYIYALSYDSADVPVARVLLLNNILVPINNNYVVKLRASYIIPNGSNYNFNVISRASILKAPGQAIYYIPIRISGNSYSSILEFINNVGSDNEWNVYNMDSAFNLTKADAFVVSNNDVITYYYYGISTSNSHYVKWKLTNGTLTKEQDIALGFSITSTSSRVFVKDDSNIYLSVRNSSDYSNKVYKVDGNSLVQIYSFMTPNTNKLSAVNLSLINGFITIGVEWFDENDVKMYKQGILVNDTPYFTSDYESVNVNSFWYYTLTSITANYNLIRMYIPTSSGSKKFVFDYNVNNYNGLEYSSYNQLVPTKGRLYANGEMVFARNLYNVTINGQTQTSTLQIPNNLLNNETLAQEDMVGATNTILMTKNETITKNKYETLYINFMETLNVTDEDTGLKFPQAANYINKNITTGTQTNCEETFIGKLKVNYSTPFIQNITWTYNTDHYETEFIVDATAEAPSSIEFMSFDETTTYIKKDLSLEVGNYYLIKQKLRIE